MIFETEGMKEMAERYYPFLHSLAWTYFPTNNSTEGREKSIFNETNQNFFFRKFRCYVLHQRSSVSF